MTVHEILESKYVSINVDLQRDYTAFRHGESLAVQDLINFQRKLFKIAAYFKVAFYCLLVKLHVKAVPMLATELIKASRPKAVPSPVTPGSTNA
jgi:hypothetical protein